MKPAVLVVGAGPAGSAAAILLARGGCRVTIVEQHRFPRDKVCGECVSALGLDVLHRLGLESPLRALGPAVFTRTTIHPTRGRSVSVQLPDAIWGISRRALDQLLLDAAMDAGASVLQPARCELIEPGATPRARVRLMALNRVETHEADLIVLADGKSALLGSLPPRTTDFGIKAHFANVDGPADAIELFGCEGLYGGLAAIEGGLWNAAFSVPAGRLREHRGDVAELLGRIVRENQVLTRRLAGVRRVNAWLASPLPRFAVRTRWPAGVIPVGNSAAALEPIGGEGMGCALRSAELAATAILSSPQSPDVRQLESAYRRLWRSRRPSCRLAACVASRPGLADLLIPTLDHAPVLARVGMRLMGK